MSSFDIISFQGKYILLGVVFTSMLLAHPSESQAAPPPCTADNAGEMLFDNSLSPPAYVYCNGAEFLVMTNSSPGDSCSDTGKIEWSDDSQSLTWCNGSNWYPLVETYDGSVKCASATDETGDLESGLLGFLQYSPSDNQYYTCGGADQVVEAIIGVSIDDWEGSGGDAGK